MIETIEIKDAKSEHISTIDSPAFAGAHPNIVNRNIIPDYIFDAMNVSWGREFFESSVISVDKVHDVLVTSEGLVFTEDLKIISETITQHSLAEQQEALERVRNCRDRVHISLPCLLMRKRGDDNFGHWIVEILPKLPLAMTSCNFSAVLLPELHGPMSQVISDSIDLVEGTAAINRVMHNKQAVFHVKELIVVSGASMHGVFMSPTIINVIDSLSLNIPKDGHQKIFVSRKGAPRDLANASEIEAALRDCGFHIVHPGFLSLRQQISAFRDARIIIGVIGAGMTNIAFSKAGARVINLCPASMPDTFFYFISMHKSHSYTEIRGHNINGGDSWDEKFAVSFDEIRKLL